MKKLLFILALVPGMAIAQSPELPDLSKGQLKDIANEFAMNFSHTAVAAPSTTGLWGVEVGLVAGQTGSPKLRKTLNDAGEDGNDFKNLYHAGLMARVHLPFEIFAELTLLPERKISDVNVSARSFAAGWNFGSHFNWPIDLAVGANMSTSAIDFKQTIQNASTLNNPVDSTVELDSTTRVYWLGASKTFLFFTPYAKVGVAQSESDVAVKTATGSGTIFSFSNSQKETVSTSGGFFAVGANLQFLFTRYGVEYSSSAGVNRLSAKFSLSF
jgi:hypothetical protein